MKYEYTTTYAPVEYGPEKGGLLSGNKPAAIPEPASLFGSDTYQRMLQHMGDQGWELVSVQPLLRGSYQYQSTPGQSYGFGYPLTAGYYLFWKRVTA